MTVLKRALIVLLVVLSCIGCDQATKSVARDYLMASPGLSLLGGTVRIQYAENNGAFLSLGSALSGKMRGLIFIDAVSVFLVGILAYLIFAAGMDLLSIIAFSLILGGGLSNLLDRIAYGGNVVDFINLGIGPVRTGIFNAADVAIMAGMFLIVLGIIFKKKPELQEITAGRDKTGGLSR